jgi:hypothetical protein
LQIFITSRPEVPICYGFQDIPTSAYQEFILQDISQPIVEQDISAIFKYKLGRIQREYNLPPDWPCEDHVKCLVEKAGGLFIYTEIACRFIRESKFSEKCLTQIIQCNAVKQELEWSLDEIYVQILQDSIIRGSDEQERATWIELFQQVVGSIVISFDLMSVDTLSKLLSVEQRQIEVVLRYLYPVLDAQDKENSLIRLLHPSFRDFLLDKRRCKDTQF